MAKKKEQPTSRHATAAEQNVMGLRSMTVEQPITQTLESNFMPYAMSVIVSRAIPEIDGFKPSHRKLLLTGWDEPWHYRYVGVEAATFIMEQGICYEEFYKHYVPDFQY